MKLITCRICHNLYGNHRNHCPTCGSASVLGKFIDISYAPNTIMELVAAYGVERVGQYRTRMIDVRLCDPDA